MSDTNSPASVLQPDSTEPDSSHLFPDASIETMPLTTHSSSSTAPHQITTNTGQVLNVRALDPNDPLTYDFNAIMKETVLLMKEADHACAKLDLLAAIECYDSILEMLPGFTRAWNSKGYCYRQLKDTAKAKAAFEQCVSIQPHEATAHHGLGQLFQTELDDTQSAMEHYKLAVQFPTLESERNGLTLDSKRQMAVILRQVATDLCTLGIQDMGERAITRAVALEIECSAHIVATGSSSPVAPMIEAVLEPTPAVKVAEPAETD
jgi:hypothetical protein